MLFRKTPAQGYQIERFFYGNSWVSRHFIALHFRKNAFLFTFSPNLIQTNE